MGATGKENPSAKSYSVMMVSVAVGDGEKMGGGNKWVEEGRKEES